MRKSFTFKELSNEKCITNFRFRQGVFYAMISLCRWLMGRTALNGNVCEPKIAVCIIACRKASPACWYDSKPESGMYSSALSEVFGEVAISSYETLGELGTSFRFNLCN